MAFVFLIPWFLLSAVLEGERGAFGVPWKFCGEGKNFFNDKMIMY